MLDFSPSNLVEKACEIAEDDVVDCTFDGAAGGVTEDENQLGSRNTTTEFHTAEHVVIDDVAGDTADESVADAGVEDDLGGNARVKAAKNHGGGVLAGGTGTLLGKIVAGRHFAGAEAFVAFLEFVEDLGGSHGVALFFGERVGEAR